MIFQVISALIGTFSFSILFSIPLIYCPFCAFCGGLSWFVYLCCIKFASTTVSTLLATMIVVFVSRILAVNLKSPATLYIIAGIFPLVPGAGVYWTTYYLINDRLFESLNTGYNAIQTALALVLGIVFIFEIPQKVFNKMKFIK